jgi:hypothetical protein
LGYFGRSFILVYLVPLMKVPKLNTPKKKQTPISAIVTVMEKNEHNHDVDP